MSETVSVHVYFLLTVKQIRLPVHSSKPVQTTQAAPEAPSKPASAPKAQQHPKQEKAKDKKAEKKNKGKANGKFKALWNTYKSCWYLLVLQYDLLNRDKQCGL